MDKVARSIRSTSLKMSVHGSGIGVVVIIHHHIRWMIDGSIVSRVMSDLTGIRMSMISRHIGRMLVSDTGLGRMDKLVVDSTSLVSVLPCGGLVTIL